MTLKDIYLFEQVVEKKVFLHDEDEDTVDLELTKNKDNKDINKPSQGIMNPTKDNPLEDDEEKSGERSHDWEEDGDGDGGGGGEPVGESIDALLEACIAKECDSMKSGTIVIGKKEEEDKKDTIEEQASLQPAAPGHTPEDTGAAANRGKIMAICTNKYPTDPVKRRMCVASGGRR